MTVTDTDVFAQEWAAWHEEHERKRASAHGFLAITSMRWLAEEPEMYVDVPGAWSSGQDGIVVSLAPGESLVVDGVEITGRHSFGVIDEGGGVTALFGDAAVEIANRGGSAIIRPRHPDNPVLTGYRGTEAYAPDPRWAIQGRFVAYDPPVPTTVGSVVDGLEHVYEAVGEIEFEVDGAAYRLIAFPGSAPGSLHVLFRDGTSGRTTYAATRSLSVEAPDAKGDVLIDFNRATNLPCAYTAHATCPLPPAANRLSIAVEAGEKMPA
ncbi:DUF1684 domain-containing protein [Nocardioides albus]|uniref:DUF1684 domain-containing protein n=1 Tax=Nocardioides albus TaxID=1841 RepID=A0A7W5A0N9_9ACTN|nr:DUF1684 domain-containing protein [Nocardioides albus]MBB3087463.1 hypothetical protein [Nocardioides albus]GGU09200.1 hypothetical protein GCM10007979_03860 [Nocardioides albus]